MAREKHVYFATLAEQAERYGEMADKVKSVAKLKQELSVEERNLISVAYKYAAGSRRATWCIITSFEQKESVRGNAGQTSYDKECCAEVELELNQICTVIPGLLSDKFFLFAGNGASKVSYYKKMGEYHHCIEYSSGVIEGKAFEDAKIAYEMEAGVALADLPVIYAICLGPTLNFSSIVYLLPIIMLYLELTLHCLESNLLNHLSDLRIFRESCTVVDLLMVGARVPAAFRLPWIWPPAVLRHRAVSLLRLLRYLDHWW